MKKIIIILIAILASTQLKAQSRYLDSIPRFAKDSALNQFVIVWLRKPYKFGGSTERGIDCSQFNRRLAKDVYAIEIQPTCQTQWETTQRVHKKDTLEVGDLVFFRSRQSPSRWHCGTYIGETMFVHASNRYEGVKVSSLKEPKYKAAYKGGGRYTMKPKNW